VYAGEALESRATLLLVPQVAMRLAHSESFGGTFVRSSERELDEKRKFHDVTALVELIIQKVSTNSV